MKRLLIFILMGIVFLTKGQDTLMTIGSEPVSSAEFIRLYKKNNSPNLSAEPMSVDQYLQLFIKYKLKVRAAKDAGYDTMKNFLDEYNRYVRLLAKSYYPDSNVVNKLLKQAYQRSKENVRVAYIVLYLPRNYTPEDTLKIYNEALKMRQKIISGQDFFEVKPDTSLKIKYKNGDSWYIDVFALPYKLENFVYDHKVGEVSMPIHHNQAYFILKILDKKPAMGKRHIAYIYVRLPKNPSKLDSLKAMDKIKKIQQALDSGMAFDKVAKLYSDDKFTSIKGGDLGWISPSSNLMTEFKVKAFEIQNVGDVIGPFRTVSGYNFIKLLEVKNIGSFEQEKDELLKELKRKKRFELAIRATTEKLKKQYNFKQLYPLDSIEKYVNEDIFKGMWKPDSAFLNDKTPLISFADKTYTVGDFAKYLNKHQRLQPHKILKDYLKQQFDNFVQQKIQDYELTQLPQKNTELKYIAKEYYDGILLFNITQDSISEVSVKDTAGLRQYYLQNKLNYYQRLNLTIYSYSNKKGLKIALKLLKKNTPDSILMKEVHKKDTTFSIYKNGIFKKGDDTIVDKIFALYENKKIKSDQKFVILKEDQKLVVIKDNFKYVRGYVLADYQNYLEEKWIERLRKKYPVKINKKVLEKVKKQLNQQ